MTRVSIIIPVYNVETYLRECLDSVVRQTLTDIEIICVNDGSTDSSPDILAEYAARDPRIQVINKPNSGYGHTMNRGLDAARGEYVGIVESDDYVPEDMYEQLYKLASQNDLDIIKADFYRFGLENGKLKLEYNELSYGRKHLCNRVLDPAENLEIFKFIMNTWSGIYKRAFLEACKIRHNESPGASYQDNGFYFQTMCQAKRVYFLDKPFYMNRRDNPNSSVKSKEKVFCIRDEYIFIRKFLEASPELLNKFLPVYTMKMYHNYLFTFNRVADEFKMMFLEHFSETFSAARDRGELRREFFTDLEWENIGKIIEKPAEFYAENREAGQNRNYHAMYRKSQRELDAIYRSRSYRIGRLVTWLPRMLKAFVRSLRNSGLRVTWRKALSKMGKRRV